MRAATSSGFGGAAFAAEIARIERESRGRLGVSVLDIQSGRAFSHRGGERFAMCSTFKFLLAAAVLEQVERGRERLDRRVPIRASDLVDHSPAVERHVGTGMTVEALCDATLTLSDNAAANLLLPSVGGIAGFNRFVRAHGDRVTRLDRDEPMMSEAIPGDPRDTTSPDAMLGLMRTILLGRALTPASRARLTAWIVANTTGDTRLRAGLPRDWRVGEKTGAGMNGATNDIAILWPPKRAPVLVTAYLMESDAPAETRYAAHAAIARAIVAAV